MFERMNNAREKITQITQKNKQTKKNQIYGKLLVFF